MAAMEVGFDLECGTHPRYHTDSETYSKDYPYERAVFLLGAARRKTNMEKMKGRVENING